MVKVYEDLTDAEQSKLSEAWLQIYKGLEVYEELTGAENLDDVINGYLWEIIYLQKAEQA